MRKDEGDDRQGACQWIPEQGLAQTPDGPKGHAGRQHMHGKHGQLQDAPTVKRNEKIPKIRDGRVPQGNQAISRIERWICSCLQERQMNILVKRAKMVADQQNAQEGCAYKEKTAQPSLRCDAIGECNQDH